MFYTVMKGLGWFLLALILGFVIGWLARSVAAKRQVARARSHNVDTAELDRLRGRIANLEPAVLERDRLRSEIDALRAAPRAASAAPANAPVVPGDGGAAIASFGSGLDTTDAQSAPDVSSARAVLGESIALDDLTVVEGIGPKINELCRGIGIQTWRDLSTTEVSLLRTMLADAGPRFRTHDPETWPQQAGLLATGRWQDFKDLTDGLRGGRSAG